MRKLITIALCLLMIGTLGAAHKRSGTKKEKPIELTGELVWFEPAGVADDAMPIFDVYWGAVHAFTKKTGMYTLKIPAKDKHRLKNISLLICKRSHPEFEQGATIIGQRVEKPNKCKWYNLDRQWDEKKKRHYWDIEEKTDVAEGDYIPENAVVLSLSGKYVVEVQNSEQKITGQTVLPRVVLKNEADVLQRQSVKSAISGIDNRMYTSEQCNAAQTKNDVDIDLAYC